MTPWAVVALALTAAGPLETAIAHYEFGEHREAIAHLSEGLERLTPLEQGVAKRYLGASHLMLGERTPARRVFHELLTREPNAQLNPRLFPPKVVEFFEGVSRQVAQVVTDSVPQSEAPPPLVPNMSQAEIKPTREHALVFDLLPFGGGQFANGDYVKGAAFAFTEVALFGAAAGSMLLLQQGDDAHALHGASTAFFWSGVGVVVVGIAEALLRHHEANDEDPRSH